MNNENSISSEPIDPISNNSVNQQPKKSNVGLIIAIIVIVVVVLPMITFTIFMFAVFTAFTGNDTPENDFAAQLEKKYGTAEDFSYVSDGNVYAGHSEKKYYSGRTKTSFTITKESRGFSDNYWSEAYGAKVDGYLDDVLGNALSPYSISFKTEGSLNGGGSIPNSTKEIIESNSMHIEAIATLDCTGYGNHYCRDMEEEGVDPTELGNQIKKALDKGNIQSIQRIDLEITKYSGDNECPTGTDMIDRKCTVNIYSR
jgi:hypothetical protein